MTPVPYNQYTKEQVHAALDSLPLSGEGLRIHVGMDVTFIVRMDSHTGGRTMLTSRVKAVTRDRVYFDTTLKDIHKISDGVPGERCFVLRDNAVKQFEQVDQKLKVDKVA